MGTYSAQSMSFFRLEPTRGVHRRLRTGTQTVDEWCTVSSREPPSAHNLRDNLTNTACPPSVSLLMNRTMLNADCPSRPEVGSSMNSRFGFATSSTPRVTRLRCSMLNPSPGTVKIHEHLPSIRESSKLDLPPIRASLISSSSRRSMM